MRDTRVSTAAQAENRLCYSGAMAQNVRDPAARSQGPESAGIAPLIIACACFASLDTGSKYVSATVPLVMVIWVRYIMQMLFTTLILLPRQGGAPFATRHPVLQVVRGFMLVLCSSLAFLSLTYMPVGEFTAITMIAPLFIMLFSALALKERVSPLRWLLVIGGFIGALIVIRPGHASFDWVMLLPLLLVAAITAFQTITSKVSKTDAAGTTHFISGLVGLVFTTLALPFFWKSSVGLLTWLLMLGIGAFGAVGHYLLIVAYSRAPASTLTPFLYFHIGFATLGGWLVFAHVPDSWALLGIAIIAVCGVAGALVSTPRQPAG